MTLADDLTKRNVLGYANACVEVAHALAVLRAEGYATVVLPSRGAFPMYKTADHVREHLNEDDIAHRWCIYPFTTDDSQGVPSHVARSHWCSVVEAESLGNPNPAWQHYQAFSAGLGYEAATRPTGFGRFILLDTAISGRAAAEIVTALNRNALLDWQLILVCDEEGAKLKREYLQVLNAYKDRITRVPTPRLYTEDRGLALMGMTTILFPEKTVGECVASSWLGIEHRPLFWDSKLTVPEMKTVTHFYSYLHAMHFYATKISLNIPFDNDEAALDYFRRSLIANSKLVNEESTLNAVRMASNLAGILEVTSSMAVRVRGLH